VTRPTPPPSEKAKSGKNLATAFFVIAIVIIIATVGVVLWMWQAAYSGYMRVTVARGGEGTTFYVQEAVYNFTYDHGPYPEGTSQQRIHVSLGSSTVDLSDLSPGKYYGHVLGLDIILSEYSSDYVILSVRPL
jgi:hypothetical protein